MANCSNCLKEKECRESSGFVSGFCGAYRPVKVTNREYFFEKRLNDTVMLLTYDDHPREECRLFKKVLKGMTGWELQEWLDAEKDKRFIW